MTKDLSAFFAQNAQKPELIKGVVSERFKDADGNGVEFEFTHISEEKDAELRKIATKNTPITQGKGKGQTKKTFDDNRYQKLFVINSISFPNLNDVELQNSYGVMDAESLYDAMLALPAERTEALMLAQKANGYEIDMQDLVEDAKN